MYRVHVSEKRYQRLISRISQWCQKRSESQPFSQRAEVPLQFTIPSARCLPIQEDPPNNQPLHHKTTNEEALIVKATREYDKCSLAALQPTPRRADAPISMISADLRRCAPRERLVA